jgi:hypothetical protein
LLCINQANVDGSKYSEIKRKLKKAGCYLYREGKRHEIWFSSITGNYFPVSRHNSEEAVEKTEKALNDFGKELSQVNFV